MVKIPNIPAKIRNEIRSIQKKIGQKKFYEKLKELDKKVINKFDPNDSQRSIRAFEIKKYTNISMYDWLSKTKSKFIESDFLKLYVDFERTELIKRIKLRTEKMIKLGAIEEVKKFNKLKVKKDYSVNKVIGVDELTKYLNKEITIDVAKELISIRTRQYAKRQSSWARSKMISWTKVAPNEIFLWIKKINKSSLKLDQLI